MLATRLLGIAGVVTKGLCRESGFSLVELLFVVAIIALLAAIGVPLLLRARMSSNEVSAQSSLRVVNLAQAGYTSTCGNDGFATSFAVLALKPPGSAEGFIPAELASLTPVKSGYRFSLAAGAGATAGELDCHGIVTQSAYYASATPVSYGFTGGRSYATNQVESIWVVGSPFAPTEPFGAPAQIAG